MKKQSASSVSSQSVSPSPDQGARQPGNARMIGTMAMVGASLCFSIGGLLMKLIPWNPLAINGARNLIACFMIGGYILFLRHRLRFNGTVLIGAISTIGVTTLFAVANKMTSAGNAIILQYTAPVWIIILMYLIYRKKPDTVQLITIPVVLTGIGFFFYESLSSGKWLGDFCALASAIFYAGVFMMNQSEKSDVLSSLFLGQLLSGIFLAPMVCFETDFTLPVLVPVFLLGAVQMGLAYIFFSIGIQNTDPVTASIINSLEPILNPILVAVFYGEMLGRLSMIGAVIVICGILFYQVVSALNDKRRGGTE